MAKLSRTVIEENVLSKLQDIEILEIKDISINYKSGTQTRTYVKYRCCKCNVIQEQSYTDIMKLYRIHRCNIEDIIDNNEDIIECIDVVNIIDDDKKSKTIYELKNNNKVLLEEVKRLSKSIELIYKTTLSLNEKNNIQYTPIQHKDKSITPIMVYTDLHYGEVIKRSHTYGYNEYNSYICEQRVIDCTKQFIDYYTNDIKTKKDRIIIACLSDSINNEHHDSVNDKSIPEQIIGVSKLYIQCFTMIKEAFPGVHIDIIFTSSNHDRIDMDHKKSPITECITNSYTFLIIHNLINAGFHIKFEDEGDWLEKVYDKRIFFTHGHTLKINTKNHNSIINNINKVNKQFMSYDKDGVDIVLCGHYHADVLTDKFIICCSPVGADPYARSLSLPCYKPGLTSLCIDNNNELCNYKVFRAGI